jgi:hypothetical protein
MAKVKCPGCGQKFQTSIGYANHKRKCKKKIQVAAAVRLDLRLKNMEVRKQLQEKAIKDQSPEQQEQMQIDSDRDDEVC